MSHILFGDFNSQIIEENNVEKIKFSLLQKGVLIFFDSEINFYDDIDKMINEHWNSNKTRFCITTVNQMYNSDDILFPYDKFSNEELFSGGENRSFFENVCMENLLILQETLLELKQILEVNALRVFVTEGYDTEFTVSRCTVQQMISDIYNQVICSFFLKSVIYEIV